MTLNVINPVLDGRWHAFLERQPAASVFHTPGWLEALQSTYGYEPIVFTSSRAGEPLLDGISFCRIKSWMGGHRLVSLPFSDHCALLADDPQEIPSLLNVLQERLAADRWKSVEIRATGTITAQFTRWSETSTPFFLHQLDLTPSLDELFDNLHKDCVQRKIQRAERERLTQEEGKSALLLAKFYGLLAKTRQRHGLPPQPFSWFQNLLACLGDKVTIRVASKDGRPVAGILTLRYKQTLVYKYGCSDQRLNQLGGMQLLLWQAIQDAKRQGLTEFDLGRSEIDNSGLVTFKDRWNAARTKLIYLRYPRSNAHSIRDKAAQSEMSRRVFACMPESVRSATGRLLYRYMG